MQSTMNIDQLTTLTTNTDQLSTLTTTTNIQTSGIDQLIDVTTTTLPNCHKHPRPCKDDILIWSYNTGGLGGTPNERRGNLELLREMGADIAVYTVVPGNRKNVETRRLILSRQTVDFARIVAPPEPGPGGARGPGPQCAQSIPTRP